MSRLRTVAIAVSGAVGFALLAGWSMHRDSPQGMAPSSAAEPCAAMVHGFSLVYTVLVGVAIGMAVVVGLAFLIASQLGLFGRSSQALRSSAVTSAMVAITMVVALLGKFVIEAAFPLSPAPGCPRIAWSQPSA